MARYEIVGLHNCPWFAKAEMLADELQHQFSNIEFIKTMKDEFQWKDFIAKVKDSRDWDITTSPVIWEILVEPYGKVNLIGGVNEFCEYVQAFFGLTVDTSVFILKIRAQRNTELFSKGFQGQDRGEQSICNLSIINGPIRLIECLLTQLLAQYSIISPNIVLNISIFNDTLSQRDLDGLCMETIDLCSENLFRISSAHSLREVMYNSDLVIILEDFRRNVEDSIGNWLNRIEWKIMRVADDLNEVASDSCRVIIGGDGPQCYVAEILRHMVSRKKVRSGHIVGVGQHVVTRAKAEISRKTEVPGGCIGRLYAYGWPGSVGAFVEVRDGVYKDGEGSIQGPQPCELPLSEIALNPHWLFNTFSQEFLQSQEKRIENGKNAPGSDMCQAEAVVNLLHIWIMSTSPNGPVPGFVKDQICCPQTSKRCRSNKNYSILPVISVGIKCSKRSSFPRGTFMVQPAVCYRGRWISAGIINKASYSRILEEVKKLWVKRQELIFRDFRLLGVISDYDLDLTCSTRPPSNDLSIWTNFHETNGESSREIEAEDEIDGEDFVYHNGKPDF